MHRFPLISSRQIENYLISIRTESFKQKRNIRQIELVPNWEWMKTKCCCCCFYLIIDNCMQSKKLSALTCFGTLCVSYLVIRIRNYENKFIRCWGYSLLNTDVQNMSRVLHNLPIDKHIFVRNSIECDSLSIFRCFQSKQEKFNASNDLASVNEVNEVLITHFCELSN